MEQLLLNLGAGLGGFAGLMAMALMVFFLRNQGASVQWESDRRQSDRELVNTLTAEIIAARRESNAVIERNTAALTNTAAISREICDKLTRYDGQAREIHRDVRLIATKLRLRLDEADDADSK